MSSVSILFAAVCGLARAARADTGAYLIGLLLCATLAGRLGWYAARMALEQAVIDHCEDVTLAEPCPPGRADEARADLAAAEAAYARVLTQYEALGCDQ